MIRLSSVAVAFLLCAIAPAGLAAPAAANSAISMSISSDTVNYIYQSGGGTTTHRISVKNIGPGDVTVKSGGGKDSAITDVVLKRDQITILFRTDGWVAVQPNAARSKIEFTAD